MIFFNFIIYLNSTCSFFLNKGKNVIKNYNSFHSIHFLNDVVGSLLRFILKYPKDRAEHIIHSAQFYFIPFRSTHFKIFKHTSRKTENRVKWRKKLKLKQWIIKRKHDIKDEANCFVETVRIVGSLPTVLLRLMDGCNVFRTQMMWAGEGRTNASLPYQWFAVRKVKRKMLHLTNFSCTNQYAEKQTVTS